MLVCPSCGEENPDRARFCMSCTAPLGLAAPAGSRKTVTIVFSDLVGSTALGEAHMALAETLRLSGKTEAASCAEAAFTLFETKGNVVSANRARAFVEESALGH